MTDVTQMEQAQQDAMTAFNQAADAAMRRIFYTNKLMLEEDFNGTAVALANVLSAADILGSMGADSTFTAEYFDTLLNNLVTDFTNRAKAMYQAAVAQLTQPEPAEEAQES